MDYLHLSGDCNCSKGLVYKITTDSEAILCFMLMSRSIGNCCGSFIVILVWLLCDMICFCFCFWHAYSYAHVALWSAFRKTFLADAFWAVFPTQRLLRRPSLVLSSTLITWIRLAFPRFRDYLIAKITELRYTMLDFDVNLVTNLERGIATTKNSPFRAKYIHLLNLHTLLEFCIPVIQNYGVALKSND